MNILEAIAQVEQKPVLNADYTAPFFPYHRQPHLLGVIALTPHNINLMVDGQRIVLEGLTPSAVPRIEQIKTPMESNIKTPLGMPANRKTPGDLVNLPKHILPNIKYLVGAMIINHIDVVAGHHRYLWALDTQEGVVRDEGNPSVYWVTKFYQSTPAPSEPTGEGLEYLNPWYVGEND